MNSFETCALVYAGDGYAIAVRHQSPTQVKILYVDFHQDNSNWQPVREKFFDLAPDVRHEIIALLNRRYSGKTILT